MQVRLPFGIFLFLSGELSKNGKWLYFSLLLTLEQTWVSPKLLSQMQRCIKLAQKVPYCSSGTNWGQLMLACWNFVRESRQSPVTWKNLQEKSWLFYKQYINLQVLKVCLSVHDGEVHSSVIFSSFLQFVWRANMVQNNYVVCSLKWIYSFSSQ